MTENDYQSRIRIIPDFPKAGIQFVDWMPMLNHYPSFIRMIQDLKQLVADGGFTKVAALESRGFMIGVPLACELNIGFVPLRKKGKLPGKIERVSYELEYGSDVIEVQEGMITESDKVLVVDDLLATGGSIQAANTLVSRFTQHYSDLFLIELTALKGHEKIDCPYQTLIRMDDIY